MIIVPWFSLWINEIIGGAEGVLSEQLHEVQLTLIFFLVRPKPLRIFNFSGLDISTSPQAKHKNIIPFEMERLIRFFYKKIMLHCTQKNWLNY